MGKPSIGELILLQGLFSLVIMLPSLRSLIEIYRILRIPTCKIGSLPPSGLVEVAGMARGTTLTSPLTRSQCIFWLVSVQTQEGRGPQSTWASKVARSDWFEVEDGSGRLRVQTQEADMILQSDFHLTPNLFKPLNHRQRNVLTRLGLDQPLNYSAVHAVEVFENTIQAGETVFVQGDLQTVNGIRCIGSGVHGALILSDRSERALLRKLYGRVAHSLIGVILATALVLLIGLGS